jgi:hypothetical protein
MVNCFSQYALCDLRTLCLTTFHELIRFANLLCNFGPAFCPCVWGPWPG